MPVAFTLALVKIVFLNRYFYPDHSATSQLLSDLAFHLSSQGREVHVITSRQRYDEPAARLPPQETIHGVTVRRVWTSTFGRGRLPGRALDYLTFYLSTFFALLSTVSRGDVVVSKTDPPLLSLAAWPAARIKGARLVNWLQDIFPEVAGAVGMGWARGWAGRLLAALRDRSLRAAHVNVVLGTAMQRYLISRGVGESQLRVIHNWADGELVRPVESRDNRLRRDRELGGKFVVGYSGNMGRVHEFETILGAAEAFKGDGGIVFLFIGGGARREWLSQETARRSLSNVMFLPYQPAWQLGDSLSAPDVHLVTLLPEAEGFVVPSKFYGIAAAARPALFVGCADGEIARIVTDAHCGIVVEAGDITGLRSAIVRLRSDKALYDGYCANARKVFEQRFDKRIALEAWGNVLE
jgi:glycosyltransferase involved in cell wall biosynthesis